MPEPVTIHSTVNGGNVKIVQHDHGRIGVGPFLLQLDELFAALIVATGQVPGVDTSAGSSRRLGLRDEFSGAVAAAQRLLDERYPPPEQWETVPATDIVPGDILRWVTGSHPVERKVRP